MNRTPRGAYPRLPAVAGGIMLASALLAARLIWLGAVAADESSRELPQSEVAAPRGTIWSRHGALLAVETYVYDVGAAANELDSAASTATALAPLLDRPAPEIQAALSTTDQRWIPLARNVDPVAAERIRELALGGIYCSPQARRTYPLGPDAAHLTGFLDAEGTAYYGIEEQYDDELTGSPGYLAGNFGTDPRAYRPPTPGSDLILTVDRDLQLAAVQALKNVVEEESATGATILVLDPLTGGILASASYPTYDPNNVVDADAAAFVDPAIAAQYEPGSVVKVMTMAAALDSGTVDAESTYEDDGVVEFAGLTITNWDRLSHGTTSMTDLLRHSLNVGAVHLSSRLGPERFYDYMAAFGFGSLTGVDLAGEVAGTVHFPSREPSWYAGNLATNSFGQGMAATPLQVATAFAAIANDGVAMPPHILAARVGPGGELAPVAPREGHRVISPETAMELREMLEQVVVGKVTRAAIPGYGIGGKTGTSQIPVAGGYDSEGTIASFVGMLPIDSPAAVILVKVVRPTVPRGSEAAAPAFREVAQAVIDILGLPPYRQVRPVGVEW